jgi:DNA-binding response OmpR family regulator
MKLRALIFDDDPLVRDFLGELLDRHGYEVFAFPDPRSCFLQFVQQCPCPLDASCADLIISDVNMHGKSGVDFLEQLVRKGCRQRHLALISGSFSESDQLRGLQLGCRLFNKPLNIPEFMAWIEDVERSIPLERTLFDGAIFMESASIQPPQNR